MPTPADHLPDDGTGLGRRLLDLTGRLQRLEAARRLEQVGVTSGVVAGVPVLTLQSPEQGVGHVTVQLRGLSADGTLPSNVLLTLEDGTALTISSAGAYLEAWAALSLSNGWTAAGGSWRSPVARRQVDGTVQLAGEIAPGTTTNGTTLFTLPATPVNYRPAGDMVFRVPGGTSTAAADLYVMSTGAVVLQNVAGTLTRLGLTCVRFPLQ